MAANTIPNATLCFSLPMNKHLLHFAEALAKIAVATAMP
jgi:hypothetical protein